MITGSGRAAGSFVRLMMTVGTLFGGTTQAGSGLVLGLRMTVAWI